MYQDISETFICERARSAPAARDYQYFAKPNAAPQTVQSPSSKGDITKDAVNAFVEGARSGKLENAAFWAVEAR